MSADFRVLIVGGYGVFGGRVVELLESDDRLTLLVAGRSLAQARSFCVARPATKATLIPTHFNRAAHDEGHLRSLAPTIVVDASGPFQAYGDHAYRLVENCIAARIHYLDLADGSDFVAGFARFDAAARGAGVFALAGVSSFPVLTSAVVRRLSAGMGKVRTIRGGIAPSPHAGVGLNVIRAIASYSGQRIEIRRHGRLAHGFPFTESTRFTIAVPGRIPLKRKRFSLVDVPDLRALVMVRPEVSDVWMGAGPVPGILHWALTFFAWLVRLRVLPSLAWLARTMHFVTNQLSWGEHRGGMFVEVTGETRDGVPIQCEWHLLAEGDDGPLIPCMAVEAIISDAMAGKAPAPGARAAVAEVELATYEDLFSRRTIHTGVRERLPAPVGPLYQRILGSSWLQLAPEIRDLHTVTSTSSFTGTCWVERGRNPLAWLIATVIGFPVAGDDQAIDVTLTAERDGERWVRSTGRRRFSSIQVPGNGPAEWLVREKFGAVFADMALVVEGTDLRYIIRRWGVFGISLPLWLGPRSTAVETVVDGAFQFDVRISHPVTGLIVRYRGRLQRSVQSG